MYLWICLGYECTTHSATAVATLTVLNVHSKLTTTYSCKILIGKSSIKTNEFCFTSPMFNIKSIKSMLLCHCHCMYM